jgi:putative transcriptional regulator
MGYRDRGKAMKRKMSYKKLWKLLIDRDMKKTDLRTGAGISSSSLAKLGKDENVTTDVLLRICDFLNVDLKEIAETVPDNKKVEKEILEH